MVVSSTHASAQPRTVVVEPYYAVVATWTVRAARRTKNYTGLAKFNFKAMRVHHHRFRVS